MDNDKFWSKINPETNQLEVFNIHTGELVWEEQTGVPVRYEGFDWGLAHGICDLIRAGKTVHEICSMSGMPDTNIYYMWRRKHPEFAAMLGDARRDRADKFHSMAVHEYKRIAEKNKLDKDEFNKSKLVMDYGMKLAERDNANSYSAKPTEHVSSPTLVIITGVPRPDKGDDYGGTVLGRSRELPSVQRIDPPDEGSAEREGCEDSEDGSAYSGLGEAIGADGRGVHSGGSRGPYRHVPNPNKKEKQDSGEEAV